jgi:hypothetical protein
MAVRNVTKIIASGLLLVTLSGCATASLQQRLLARIDKGAPR